MRKRHIFLRSILGLLAILLLLPLVLTLIYSFCSSAEIKEFMGTRNQYGKQLMEIKLSPEMFSLDSGHQHPALLFQLHSVHGGDSAGTGCGDSHAGLFIV